MRPLIVTAEHLRASRGLLDWSQGALAEAAGVHVRTIRRLEATPGPVSANQLMLIAIVRTLEKAGVELLGDGRPGVRFRVADRGTLREEVAHD